MVELTRRIIGKQKIFIYKIFISHVFLSIMHFASLLEVCQQRIEFLLRLHILLLLMGSDGCLVASAVFKTVEGSYAALVGSIPSLSAFSH